MPTSPEAEGTSYRMARARSTPPGDPGGTRWTAVFAVYMAGVLAAAGLGQVGAVLPLVQRGLQVNLTEIGWAVSAMTVTAALIGLPAGLWVQRMGARRAMLIGLLTMALTTVGGALIQSYSGLLAARILGGVGYLLVVVSAPNVIVKSTNERDRPAALAIWSTFVPIGIALSAFVGGMVGPVLGWRGWFLVCAVAIGAAAAAVRAMVRPESGSSGGRPTPRPRLTGVAGDGSQPVWLLRPVLLAFGFCAVSAISVALTILQPAFLLGERGLPLWSAGLLTAIVSLASVPGSLLAGLLLRRGVPSTLLTLFGLVVPAAALLAFGAAGWQVNTAAAVTISLATGVLIAAVFAAVPVLAGDDRRMDVTNGLIAQLGSVGALLGPPLLGRAATSWGWGLLAVPVAAVMLPGSALIWCAVHRLRPPSR